MVIDENRHKRPKSWEDKEQGSPLRSSTGSLDIEDQEQKHGCDNEAQRDKVGWENVVTHDVTNQKWL